MKMKKLRISLIGPYPPPYGGVSIHIQRLKQHLEKHEIEYCVYDYSGVPKKENQVFMIGTSKWNTIRWLLSQLLLKKENIVHFHGYFPFITSIISLIVFKRKRIIITLHFFRHDTKTIIDSCFMWISRITRIHFIVVGPEIKENIISFGIKSEMIDIIPAFIPPVVKEKEIAEIPQEIWHFLGCHHPIISANASKITFYNNNDLYGLDMCIDLCANLKQFYPRIGLVCALSEISDSLYFNILKQRIKEKKIEDNFLFQTQPCQYYPIIMKSTVFVRPTNSDGDAVSVREALHFGIPSVASDCISRPESTILFKNRDIDDFTIKVKDILDNYTKYKEKLNHIIQDNYADNIIIVYHRMLNNG
jgi:glycosyltransferase involved in cell wall biosynthesis